jgi:hypothetical protein
MIRLDLHKNHPGSEEGLTAGNEQEQKTQRKTSETVQGRDDGDMG